MSWPLFFIFILGAWHVLPCHGGFVGDQHQLGWTGLCNGHRSKTADWTLLGAPVLESQRPVSNAQWQSMRPGWVHVTWHDMAWHDMAWHDMTWHGMTWHDMVWHDMTWHDMIWHVSILDRRKFVAWSLRPSCRTNPCWSWHARLGMHEPWVNSGHEPWTWWQSTIEHEHHEMSHGHDPWTWAWWW